MSFTFVTDEGVVTWDDGKVTGVPVDTLLDAEEVLRERDTWSGTPTGPFFPVTSAHGAFLALRSLWPDAEVSGDAPVFEEQDDELQFEPLQEAYIERLHPRGRTGEWVRKLSHVIDAPIHVGDDVERAVKLLGEGKRIEFEQPRQVSTLLDRLREIVADAQAKGEQAPRYDLCRVSVKGTNLFCVGGPGVERVKMPQLRGEPIKGSKADKLAKDANGRVALDEEFVKHLTGMGVQVTDGTEDASYLRASQRELDGAKVAGIAKSVEEGRTLKPIFVSREGYVIDGHHNWAGTVGASTREGKEIRMPVRRIDMPILDVLDEARRFTKEWGLPGQSATDIKQEETLPPKPTDEVHSLGWSRNKAGFVKGRAQIIDQGEEMESGRWAVEIGGLWVGSLDSPAAAMRVADSEIEAEATLPGIEHGVEPGEHRVTEFVKSGPHNVRLDDGRIFDAEMLAPEGDTNERIVGVLGSITSVHGVRSTHLVPPVPFVEFSAGGDEASYSWDAERGDSGEWYPNYIRVSPEARRMELAVAHEMGHYFDNQALDGPRRAAFESERAMTDTHMAAHGVTFRGEARQDSPLLPVMQAIYASRAWERLTELLHEDRVYYSEAGDDDFQTINPKDYRVFTSYLLDDKELFARAYAQWIGLRSNNAAIRAQARGQSLDAQQLFPAQWAEEDFEPIALAFDRVFRQLGWIGG